MGSQFKTAKVVVPRGWRVRLLRWQPVGQETDGAKEGFKVCLSNESMRSWRLGAGKSGRVA